MASNNFELNITIPFPPMINLNDVIIRYWNLRKMPPLRPPNSTFIYGLMFEQEAFNRGSKLDRKSLYELSKRAWLHENDAVKSHYSQLAMVAKAIHNKTYEDFIRLNNQ